MRTHKFKKGEPISSLKELVTLLEAEEWVYWHDVPKHPKVIMNMALATLQNAICHNLISIAKEVKND